MKVYAVMCIRNEEYYLKGFLEHIRNYVDGIVALDDGSSDNTIDILEKEPKVIKIIKNPVTNVRDWDEPNNRKRVLNEARKLGADWALCCDPDERFEIRFLKKISKIINGDRMCYGVHFRGLYGSKKNTELMGFGIKN